MEHSRRLPLLVLACLVSPACGLLGLTTAVDVEHERVITEGGVEYEDIIVGEGPAAQLGEAVRVDYVGFLSDGSEFDSSADRGFPIDFTLGEAPLPGWDEGIPGMRAKGRRRMNIPPQLAYGEQGIPGLIPENEPLIFEIYLVEILTAEEGATEEVLPEVDPAEVE